MDKLGRYELMRRVGVGGMAEVWKARALGPAGFEKTVAIKKILPHLTRDPEFITMFIDEAKLAASMEHANVVRVFDFGYQGDLEDADYFIAMEYVAGQDLATVLDRSGERRISPQLAAYVTVEIARGLAHAHEGGEAPIIHRDVSPANILVSYEGDVKITDFGVAKVLSELNRTAAGVMKGKTSYVSPEQTRFDPLTAASDEFSLACVFVELLIGRKLFDADSADERVARIRNYSPGDDETLDMLSDPVRAVLDRALANDPKHRYGSLSAFGAAVGHVVEYDRDIAKVLLAKHLQDLFQDEHGSEATGEDSKPRRLEVTSRIGGTPSDTLRKRLDAPTVAHLTEPGRRSSRRWWVGPAAAVVLVAGGVVLHNLEPPTSRLVAGTEDMVAYQHYFEGIEAFEANEATTAEEHFEKAVELDPDFAMAQYQLAETLIWRGRHEEARPHLERAFELYEQDPRRLPAKDYQLMVAQRTILDEELETAIELLEQVVRKYPEEKRAFFKIGDIYFHSLDPEKSVEYFERTLEIDPTLEVAHGHLLWNYVKLSDHDGIREHIPKMLERLRTRVVFEHAATSYIAIPDYDAALAVLEEGSRIHPNTNLDGNLLGGVHLFAGNLEQWEKARMNASGLAYSYQYLGRYEEADARYQEWLAEQPREADQGRAHGMRALMLAAGTGDEPRAREVIEEALDGGPLDTGAAYLVSLALLHLGDVERAEEIGNLARPSDRVGELVDGYACTDAGLEQMVMGRPLVNFRYSTVHQWWIARCYEQRGQLKQARATWQALIARPVFDNIYTIYSPLAQAKLDALDELETKN